MIEKLRTQFQYDARILLSNSYWLLVIPLVASQLVVFWHMAVAAVVRDGTVASTCELVVPLLAAFLCAHVVAPEHRNRVDELTFVRPVSILRTVILRLIALYTITVLLAAVMLFVYKVGLKQEFTLSTLAIASVPSILFLSMLSMAFASAWRTPAAGIGAALVYWAVDAAWGSGLNPLFGLHEYSVALNAREGTEQPLSSAWLISKGALLVMALVAAWAGGKTLGRPAAPKRWRAGLRVASGAAVCAVVYLVTGGLWQYSEARREAETDPLRARQVYVDAFAAYGPLPVALMFGPSFAGYAGYLQPGGNTIASMTDQKEQVIGRLRNVAERWPESRWADDALFEVIRLRTVRDPGEEDAEKENKLSLMLSKVFLDRYPTSPFAPHVAARMVILARRLNDEATMMWAYGRVTGVYGQSQAASDAATEMRTYYLEQGKVDKAIESARAAMEAAPPESKPEAELSFAGFLVSIGQKDEARAIYSRVEQSVQAKLEALGLAVLSPDDVTEDKLARRAEIVKLRAQARAGLAALDAPPAAAPAKP